MIDLHTYLSERYQIKDIAIHPQTGVQLIKDNEYQLKLRELSEEYSFFKFQSAVSLRDLNKIKSVFEHYCMNIQEDSLCGLGVYMTTIKANGNIYPCYTLSGFEEYKMASSFYNIGEHFTHVQNQFLSNKKTDIQECSKCDILKLRENQGLFYTFHIPRTGTVIVQLANNRCCFWICIGETHEMQKG